LVSVATAVVKLLTTTVGLNGIMFTIVIRGAAMMVSPGVCKGFVIGINHYMDRGLPLLLTRPGFQPLAAFLLVQFESLIAKSYKGSQFGFDLCCIAA
jgi:hypothetical protein